MFQKKNFQLLSLLTIPTILHFAASYFYIYPIGLRLFLYNIPFIIILIITGINETVNLLNRFRFASFIPQLITIAISINVIQSIFQKYPIKSTGSREIIDFLNKETPLIKGDTVYFSYLASFPMNYYRISDSHKEEIFFQYINGAKTAIFTTKWTADSTIFFSDLTTHKNRRYFVFSSVGEERDKCKMFETFCFNNDKNIILKKKIGETTLFITSK
jgi:hypothetical protein